MLVPPENFGLVEPGIYRCTKLESEHFPFLETLQLKSLIVLDAEKPPRLLKNFLESNKIDIYNLGGLKISNHHHTGANSSSNKDDNDDESISSSSTSSKTERRETNVNTNEIEAIKLSNNNKNDQWMLIEKNLILGTFELLLNKTKHNILLIDSTSTLIGILRKLQKWNFNSIINEYRIYSGNSNKSNYYAENFLELIQTELIPYEIDRLSVLMKQQDQSPQGQKQKQKQFSSSHSFQSISNDSGEPPVNPEHRKKVSRNNSIDTVEYDNDNDSIDDEDIDDELLSASPQIPANLLKLVEMRNQDNPRQDEDESTESKFTPGSSPKYCKNSRNNSFSNEMFLSAAKGSFERRYSMTDSKFGRSISNTSVNQKFRNQNLSSSIPTQSSRSSFESVSGIIRKLRERDDENDKSKEPISQEEAESIREKYDFRFYKNLNKYPINFEDVSVIKLKLPPDNKLPDWFIKNRNFWETNFQKINNL